MAAQSYCSWAARGRSKRLTASPSPIISTLGDDEDLLVEILIRLPGSKSALQCKSVCRRWNALISAPYFSLRFVSHHQSLSADESEQPVLTISQVRRLISSFLPFPYGTESRFSVLDSVKDLLLLGFWDRETSDQELRRTHLVCNPFTKQWVALPLAPKMAARYSRYRWVVKLVCEPLDEFRVVRMYNPMTTVRGGRAKVDVYIFCSRSRRWTKSVLTLDANLMCWGCTAYERVVSTNGKFYWLIGTLVRGVVVKWDPFCRDYGTTFPMLLEGCQLDSQMRCYGPWISEGAVHIVCKETSMSSMLLSVWRLVEDGKGGGCWRKEYEVLWSNDLSCTRKSSDGGGSSEIETLDLRFDRAVGMHPEKPEIVFLLAFHSNPRDSAILSWNFRNSELEFVTYQDDDEPKHFIPQDEKVFQPRVGFWPSLIASCEKLRNVYNGSYSCWLPPPTSN
ncbi:unnamed protein product [Linum trigynum]|uniref:F-box protein At3g26010-like beta-propeller domain-containing protein n=1 Tax=Linum trigynum TaxID=586398 RepID=A0AAV2G5I2_9ROSI